MRKKKGSLLIEAVVGILILAVVSLLAFTISISIIRSIKDREEARDRSESIYAVCNELKYNYSTKNIEDFMSDNEANIPYNKGFLSEVKTVDLFNIKDGENSIGEFKMEFLERKSEFDRIRVTLFIKNEEVLEQSFIKAPWMSEI